LSDIVVAQTLEGDSELLLFSVFALLAYNQVELDGFVEELDESLASDVILIFEVATVIAAVGNRNRLCNVRPDMP
jgi:hypothetical protein